MRNEALRQARVQRNWTQSTLAAQLNTSRITVVRWEQGKTVPSLYFREQLCALFKMTAQELGLEQPSLKSHQSHIWYVPAERSPFFTDRETVLRCLSTALWEDPANAASHIQIISGPAGIGKTQVALEYAHRFRKLYSSIIWLHVETFEIFLADLTRLAEILQLPAIYEHNRLQAVQGLRMWLEMASNWLVIFDNVEEFAVVHELLPVSRCKGHVLITTRTQATGRLNNRFVLKEMDADEGALLLLRRAKLLPLHHDLAQVSPEQRTLARELCEQLGGFPLALDQAGSYIEETGCGLAGYVERFQRRCSVLLSWRGNTPGNYSFSMTATVLLAREKAARRSAVALDLLHLCAFLYPTDIPEQLITRGAPHLGSRIQKAVADLLSLDEAFAALNASSLLRRNAETRVLHMHRLVQSIIRDQLELQTQYVWVERALQALHYVFPASGYHERVLWPLCELLLPHILTCIGHVECLPPGKHQERVRDTGASLLLKAASYLLEQARHHEAEAFLKRALDLCALEDGSVYVRSILVLRTMALLYQKLGNYTRAEALVRQILFNQQRELAEDDLSIAQTLITLAQLSGWQGKYADAEKFAHQALQSYQQAGDHDRYEMTEVFTTLAQISIWTGRYQIAVSWATRSLDIIEKTLGSDHPSLAGVIHSMAIASWEQGNYEQAEKLFQRAFGIWKHTLGPEHPFTGYPLHNQALLCKVRGEYQQAEELFWRVFQLWEQTFGPNHPERADPLKNLGEVYLLQQRYEEAEHVLQQALEIYQQSFGQEHPHMAVPWNILAAIAAEQEDYERAERLYQQSCQLCKQKLDQEHPYRAMALHGLGRLYMKRSMDMQAKFFFQQALTIRIHTLGMLHPDTQLTRELYQSLLTDHHEGEPIAVQDSVNQ